MIFPQLDHKATKVAIQTYFDIKNAELKANEPLKYRANKLKAAHLQLMMKLKDMYSSYLKQARTSKSYDRVFWVAQTAIANEFGSNRSTIYRLLNRLEKFGLVEHSFHGINRGIRIRFNQSLMIAANDVEYSLKSLENAKIEASPRPNFALFYPATVAKCNHNVSCNSLINSNMEDVELFISNKQHAEEMNNGSFVFNMKHKDIEHTNLGFEPVPTTGSTSQETNFAAGGENLATESQKQVEFFVEIALKTILSTLYSSRWFSPNKLETAKKHLSKYFTANPNAEKSRLMEQLTYRVILAHYYVQASPERFVPDVDKWLDPYFEYGFTATRKWYLQSRAAEKSNKEYNSNKKLLAKCLKLYYASPSLQSYQMGCRTLSRKHDKNLIEIYNRCVADKTAFTHQTFNYQHN